MATKNSECGPTRVLWRRLTTVLSSAVEVSPYPRPVWESVSFSLVGGSSFRISTALIDDKNYLELMRPRLFQTIIESRN